MRKAAKGHIPRFAYDYLSGGIGNSQSLHNNRQALDNIVLTPKYLVDNADNPNCKVRIFNQQFDRPFGIAPVGLGGLIWPGGAQALALAAKRNNIPFCLSSFATVDMETIADIAGEHAWYQHYMVSDDSENLKFLNRALKCGYKKLIITVDIPTATRRAHDIRNGLSVPPRFNYQTLLEIAKHPRWALETSKIGIPRFQNFAHLLPPNASMDEMGLFFQTLINGHVSLERLKLIRDHWPHTLIVKGILGENDALKCKHLGIDGIVVSNHGGRQLDAAESALTRIQSIRNVIGDEMTLIADGGVLTGLDIIRYLAKGADFVLAGRAFMYGVAAMGKIGAEHVTEVLFEEFECTMAQLGCNNIKNLPQHLEKTDEKTRRETKSS